MPTAYGRGMAGLLGEFDTTETEVKAERQQLAAMKRAEKGKPPIGVRLTGYALDGTLIGHEGRSSEAASSGSTPATRFAAPWRG